MQSSKGIKQITLYRNSCIGCIKYETKGMCYMFTHDTWGPNALFKKIYRISHYMK